MLLYSFDFPLNPPPIWKLRELQRRWLGYYDLATGPPEGPPRAQDYCPSTTGAHSSATAQARAPPPRARLARRPPTRARLASEPQARLPTQARRPTRARLAPEPRAPSPEHDWPPEHDWRPLKRDGPPSPEHGDLPLPEHGGGGPLPKHGGGPPSPEHGGPPLPEHGGGPLPKHGGGGPLPKHGGGGPSPKHGRAVSLYIYIIYVCINALDFL
jgi:hypothetical protein